LVIGCPGAGKSSFAKRLAPILKTSVSHLDKVYWSSGWQPLPADVFQERLAELVAGEEWIIDGMYADCLRIRLERATSVLWLDYSTPRCLVRFARRVIGNFGRQRDDIAEGCKDRVSLGFAWFILSFNYRKRLKIQEALGRAPRATGIFRFRHPKEAEDFLRRNAH
jgi:adenylate kinase family enzyme